LHKKNIYNLLDIAKIIEYDNELVKCFIKYIT